MRLRALWAFTTACALLAGAWAQTWFEQGDAGDLPETAQSTGSGTLTAIQGNLDENDVDMYAIYITDPSAFSASTVDGATWDTQLWLFDADGKGVVSEDDTDGLQSTIDNTNGCIPGPGLYYLAITRYNKDPLGCNGGLLWSLNDNNCADGSESTSRVNGWTASSSSAGAYTITLTGVAGATAGDPADCPPFEGWDELRDGGGDAGDVPETAQSTGSGTLTAIRGDLGADDVDMYAIYIADPSTFSASTVGSASFDTQLWLFDADGKGIVFNDDAVNTSVTQSTIDNSTFCIPAPGLYYLAISRYNRDATGCGDYPIWNNEPFREVRCPDGPESTSRVSGWTGSTSAAGTYVIQLTGAEGATAGNPDDCPPPGPDVWREQEDGGGDAGDLPATAQLVNRADSNPCTDPVTRIRGDMEADGVDMYVICITDPNSFVATTEGGASWDTQLWLFRCDGTGVVANDDSSGLQSRIDNTPGCITEPGTYLLAITRYDRDAVDANGNLLWSSGALSCADNTNPIAGWTGSTAAQGAYSILITGGYFVGPNGCEGGGSCEGDVNSDGVVDDADLLEVLFNFGCSGFCGPSDVNLDGTVDDADLLIVLFNFGCGA